jgi:hypothetical protein
MNSLDTLRAEKDKLYLLGEKLIEIEVKKLFNRHKNLVEFSDEMGLIRFTDNKGETIYLMSEKMNSSWRYVYYPTYKTFETLLSLYELLDGVSFGITLTRDK